MNKAEAIRRMMTPRERDLFGKNVRLGAGYCRKHGPVLFSEATEGWGCPYCEELLVFVPEHLGQSGDPIAEGDPR